MTLLECFDKHGTDKGSLRHRYDRFYAPIFEPIRTEKIRLLEIGIFNGASIAAWLDYFPNAEIIGVDTFQRTPPESIEILKHPRVTWWQLDSTKAAPDIEQVDFVIDDGSHTEANQSATFSLYWPLVRQSGAYFVEDVTSRHVVAGYGLYDHTGAAGERLIEVRVA